MTPLQIDADLPEITPAQSLAGWRREVCVEVVGDGALRIFVRAVEASSFKATELQRAVLFQRLDPRFNDLAGCVQALQGVFDSLAATARRTHPDKENLFRSVEYDRVAWERVQQGLDRWGRR